MNMIIDHAVGLNVFYNLLRRQSVKLTSFDLGASILESFAPTAANLPLNPPNPSRNLLKVPEMPRHGRTRSRRGCSQCVRVSRKCDESHPVCNRCRRLGFACDYTPRFLWKSYNPGSAANSVASTKAPISNSARVDCKCTNRLTGTQLLDLCE